MVDDKRLIEILKNIEQNIATDEEIQFYNDWCNSFQNTGRQEGADKFENKRAILFERITHKINKRKYYLRSVLTAAAAAIVIVLLSLPLYKYFNKTDSITEHAVITERSNNDTLPLKIKGTLALADGRTIELSSLEKNFITMQNGQAVLQLSDSTISLKETAATTSQQERSVSFNALTIGKGQKIRLILPDGSNIRLNAATTIKFPTSFKGLQQRKVKLDGEAYFDVAHDEIHPFIIETNSGDVKVMGTSFNVKALHNGFFETTLIQGKVAVALKNQTKKEFILKPGQKLVTQSRNDKADIAIIKPFTLKDSLVWETAWTKGRLSFVDKSLGEIAVELEKAFDVVVEFRSEKTKQYRYTGVYDDTSLDQILEILKLSRPITFHHQDNIVVIE